MKRNVFFFTKLLCAYRSITRDAFPGELEEIVVIVTVAKNLGKGDSLTDVVQAVLV
jgi:hypothetical protein